VIITAENSADSTAKWNNYRRVRRGARKLGSTLVTDSFAICATSLSRILSDDAQYFNAHDFRNPVSFYYISRFRHVFFLSLPGKPETRDLPLVISAKRRADRQGRH